MGMKSAGSGSLVVGLLLGVGIGWGAATFVGEEPAEPPLETAEAGTPEVDRPLPDGPRLPPSLHAPAPSVGGNGRSDGETQSPRAHLSDAEAAGLRAFEGIDVEDAEGNAKALPALAMLYALAGREADFVRVAERAIALGLPLPPFLPAFRALPAESRVHILDAVLARHPDMELPAADLARLYLEADARDRAMAVVQDALDRTEGPPGTLLALMVEIDPDGAAAYLIGNPRADTWGGEHLQMLVSALQAAGRQADAIPILRARLDQYPGDAMALQQLASLDPGAALVYAQARAENEPGNAEAWSYLGNMHNAAGDPASAFEAFRRAAELSPYSGNFNQLWPLDPERAIAVIEALIPSDSTDDEALGALAKAYEAAGRMDEAMDLFLRAHDIDPADTEWINHMSQIDPERTLGLLRAQMGEDLTGVSDEVIGDFADALRAAGHHDEAFEHYLEALERDPADWEWQNALVNLDPERALPLMEARAQANPNDAAALSAYGRALAAVGRESEAISVLTRAIEHGATHLVSELAQIDPGGALSHMEAAVRASPTDDELWGDYGDLLRQMGRESEAREAYTRARQLDPDDSEWINALGGAHNAGVVPIQPLPIPMPTHDELPQIR